MADDGHRMGDGRMHMHGYWSDEMGGQGRPCVRQGKKLPRHVHARTN